MCVSPASKCNGRIGRLHETRYESYAFRGHSIFIFPNISNTNMAAVRTSEVGAIQIPLKALEILW
jgi:hypothetical protein